MFVRCEVLASTALFVRCESGLKKPVLHSLLPGRIPLFQTLIHSFATQDFYYAGLCTAFTWR